MEELAKRVDAKIGTTSIISLYLRQFIISVIFQQQSDFELALKMTQSLVDENLKYFDGNEINETLIDPYMILASIYLQTNKIGEASQVLQKAENIVMQLSGEVSEKMIEIFSL
jgi:hypothetical protein